MNKLLNTQTLICLLFLSNAVHGYPGGLQWYYGSPRHMGMGFTGAALWDGLSPAAYSPGTIALSRYSGVELGSSWLRPATSFLEAPPGIYLENSLIPVLTPLFLNSIIHLTPKEKNRGVAIGVSVNQPFGSSSVWPDTWKGKYLSQEFTLNTYFAHLSVAVRVNEGLGLAVGGSYGALTLLSRRALRDTDGQNLDVGSVALSGADILWGVFAGVAFRANERLSWSATLRSPMEVSITRGTADFSVPASLESLFPDQNFSTSFWLPPSLDLGCQFQPQSRLQLSATCSFVAWSIWDSLLFVLEEPVEALIQFPEKAHRNALSLRAGGEYAVGTHLFLRGGLYLENTPVPEDKLSPEFPDATAIGITTGLGWQPGERISLDVAYQFGSTGERTGLLSQANFGGTYESNLHAFSAGISYRW